MDHTSADTKRMNSASLIDMKAELFRKQEEFKQQKLLSNQSGFIKGKSSTTNKKPSLFSKKNTGVSKRAEKDYEEKKEEENVFEKSRQMLEKKARLYDKISSGSELPEEDGSGVFLVDFQKKVLDDIDDRRERERLAKEREEEEEERRLQALPIPDADTEQEQWVDYVDAFGRSRRCLKKDLPALKQQDQKLEEKKRSKEESSRPSLLSDDMARELDRQQWEQRELDTMEEEKEGPLHYSDVRYNEVRTHGVGFYKFDKEEEARKAQMDQLHSLRQQTKDERSKSDRVKEKRKLALAARLAKVKQRKRAKLGLTGEDEEEDASKSSEEDVGRKLSEQTKPEPEPLSRDDDSWRTSTPSNREWDKGKQVSMETSERSWLEKQRLERENEFAPPSFYCNQSSTTSSRAKTFDTAGHTVAGKGAEVAPPSAYSNDSPTTHSTSENTTEKSSKEVDEIIIPTDIVSDNVSEISKTVEQQLQYIRQTHDTNRAGTLDDNCGQDALQSQVTDVPPPPPPQGQFPADTSQMFNMNQTGMFPPSVSVPPPNYNTMSEVDLTIPPPNLQLPPPHFPGSSPNAQDPPTSINVPPPNMYNAPPPNMQIQPQNMQIPAPNMQVPPPNMYAPPPNIQEAPPNIQATNINVPPPGFYSNSDMTATSIQNEQSSITNVGFNPVDQQSSQTSYAAAPQMTVKKIIPKETILDTRLMESGD